MIVLVGVALLAIGFVLRLRFKVQTGEGAAAGLSRDP